MFLNDQETATDLLYYEAIAKTVVNLIRRSPEAPVTVGVHGDWGEPDIDVETLDTGELQVTVKGVDVYDPNTGDIRSSDVRDIAAWFIDTDYNEESFFVRHAYFLGASDPYKALKTALRAEIDEDAWVTLYRATSRPFRRPRDGVIAVKVINHFGDEVMKVYRV